MHYSMVRPGDPGAVAILDAALRSFKADREMQKDLARLGKACCEPMRLITIQGAPIPTRFKTGLA